MTAAPLDRHDELRNTIAAQAAAWYERNREPTMRDTHHADFMAWLQQSPLCVGEYLEIARLAQDLGRIDPGWSGPGSLADDGIDADENVIPLRAASPAKATAPRLGHSHALRWGVSIAATLLLACGAWWGIERSGDTDSPSNFRTVHGEQRTWRLPDGSVLQLNSDSQVTVRYSKAVRLVELNQGQAFFKVAHEPNRKFRVNAGLAEVVAIGTEFEVYRTGGAALVTVSEGRVAIFPELRDGEYEAVGKKLSAGQQLRIDSRRMPAATSAVDTKKAMAWTRKQIVLDGMALRQAVQEFNRYSAVPIVLEGGDLGSLQIGGVFDAYDTASFIEFLKRAGDFEVIEERERVVVRHLAPHRTLQAQDGH